MSGQVWAVSASGGYLYSDQLSDYLRMQLLPTVRFRQFCDADDFTDKGLGVGDVFHWNVYSKVSNAGGRLVETTAMPTTSFTISQGTGYIYEYGNSVAATLH